MNATAAANGKSTLSDGQAGQITRAEELAYELKIVDVMTPAPRFVAPATSMAEVLELLRQARISGVPVLDDGRLVGVVSLEDLVRAMRGGQPDGPVSAYMTPSVISVKSTDPVVEALQVFTRTRVGRLPVLGEDGRLAGILTKGDITRGLLRNLQREFQAE